MSVWRLGSMPFRGASTLGLKSSGARGFGRASQRRRRSSAWLGSGSGPGRDGGEPSQMDAPRLGSDTAGSAGVDSGGTGHGFSGSRRGVVHSCGAASSVFSRGCATAPLRMETVSAGSSLGLSLMLVWSVIGGSQTADSRSIVAGLWMQVVRWRRSYSGEHLRAPSRVGVYSSGSYRSGTDDTQSKRAWSPETGRGTRSNSPPIALEAARYGGDSARRGITRPWVAWPRGLVPSGEQGSQL